MKRIFNMASLLSVAVMLISCGEKAEVVDTGFSAPDFQLIVTNDVFQSNGVDGAKFTALWDGTDVTADVTFKDAKHNELQLENGVLKSNKDGVFQVYAIYGTMSTYDKNARNQGLISVRAVSYPVPAVATDPNPGKTSFVHRAFLTQYTGINCPNCPKMIDVLRELIADQTIPAKAVLAAVHSYSGSGTQDPAYISNPSVNSYPYLEVDLNQGFMTDGKNAATLRSLVNQSVADQAKAGVSVNSIYYPEKNTIVVKVQIKALEDGLYNVGAWLLEDNIFGQQAGAENDSYNIHNNCVRIADSYYYDTYFGHFVGQLKAGQTAEKTFVMTVKDSWVAENLHLAAFVSHGYKKNGKTYYTVANAVDAPINGEKRYEYK